jgi:CHAT domain-containing protein
MSWLEDAIASNLEAVPGEVRVWARQTLAMPPANRTEEFAFYLRCIDMAIDPRLACTRDGWLRRFWSCRDGAGAHQSLFAPLLDWYLSSRLRCWPHWALRSAYIDAIVGAAALRVEHGDSDDHVAAWINGRWLSASQPQCKAVVGLAHSLLNDAVAAGLDRVLPEAGVSGGEAAELGRLHSNIAPPRYILNAAAIVAHGGNKKSDPEKRKRAEQVTAWLSAGLELERLQVRSLNSRVEGLMPEDVADAWRIVRLSDEGLRRPIGVAIESPAAPEWVVACVVGLGARLMHEVLGPLPYWFATFDNPVKWGAPMGLAEIEESEDELSILLVVENQDAEGGQVVCPFVFSLEMATHLLHLCFLVAVGGMRIDFFCIDHSVEVLGCLYVELPDPFIARIRETVTRRLSEEYGSDLSACIAAMMRGHESDDSAGFMAGEWSKGEDIHEDIAFALCAVPDIGASAEWRGYQEARSEWLSGEASFARRIHAGRLTQRVVRGSARAELAAKRTGLVCARERLRGRYVDAFAAMSPEARVARLRAVLSAGEAFVHINVLSESEMHAFVLRNESSEVLHYPMLDAPLVSAARLLRDADKSHNEEALRRALRAVSSHMKGLLDELHANGVRHVIASLPGLLDSLPVHILPVGSGNLPAFEMFESVTLCLSAMLFSERVRRPEEPPARDSVPVRPISVLGYEGLHGLAHFGAEIESVATAWKQRGMTSVWTGASATPRRFFQQMAASEVLHLVAHGGEGESPLQSCVELGGFVPSDGLLTVADVLRHDALQEAARVVVLSACHSGAHRVGRGVPHTVTALDNSLLRLGARCVVASGRRLSGEDAACFARAFHQALAAQAKTGMAYRRGLEAVVDGCQDDDVTRLWYRLSPFRLVGDPQVRIPVSA